MAIATIDEMQNISGTSVTNSTGGGINGAPAVSVTYTASLNDISGNTGNVGVNVSAGFSNLQANSLAIAATQ